MRETYVDKIRAVILADPDQVITSHIIRQKIPGIGVMAGETLRKMQKAGELRRVNTRGRPTFKLNTSYRPATLADLPAPAQTHRAAAGRHHRHRPQQAAPSAQQRPALHRHRRPQPEPLPAPPLSARIADDIAAFEAKGGQVERLGNTERFRI